MIMPLVSVAKNSAAKLFRIMVGAPFRASIDERGAQRKGSGVGGVGVLESVYRFLKLRRGYRFGLEVALPSSRTTRNE